ncbi:MAG: type II toxin-antitoxin system Phd/YefM family antitoxin, partial [Verrucomicrobia bacterium]|nr:type II toxin-antitoxin system Phd/YefM family antitoxin [Verrucomicrobiota bacterium]
MKTVGLFEAKTRLSELCREVARTGQDILVTRRGVPLTRLCPPEKKNPGKSSGILADLAAF